MDKLRVLQMICPVGFYGAERWVVALGNNFNAEDLTCELAVTKEGDYQNLEILPVYRQSGFSAHAVEMSSSMDPRVITKLVTLIKKQKIQIVHTHGYKSDILGLAAARIAGVKCVSTPHGFGIPATKKLRAFTALGKLSLRFMDAVAPLSRQLEQEVLAAGVAAKKITYIQNAVDLLEVDNFLADKPASSAASKTVGFVGQMIPRKNITDLLDVFDALWRDDANLKLQLLGDGPERPALEVYAKTLESFPAIEFLGFRADRLALMAQFDLFAMTSRDEGIPRCLMEAMALKIPVAAYDIQGIDQLVENNRSGRLTPLGDKASLQQAWKDILYDPAMAESLGEEARATIDRNFSAKRMAAQYLELYRGVMAQ